MQFRVRSSGPAPWVLALSMSLLASCGQDWDPLASSRHPVPDRAGPLALGVVDPDSMVRSTLPAMQSFARLPDRGNLIGFPVARVERQEGAYTWHRANISEAHALRAVIDGPLRITTPDGQALEFAYERHVEHPSGDWTWVGRLGGADSGRQAIVTFGPDAVFGTFDKPDGHPLRLAMRDGLSWLIETDPKLQAAAADLGLRGDDPDFLIPPGVVSSPRARGAVAEGLDGSPGVTTSGAMAATPSMSSVTVDLLVGYTPGFAAAQGGTSQAVTRINYLVDVTNQAYINSQMDRRVRLVHAMEVAYPDATNNGEVLKGLTGYDTSKSGSARYVTPDPAFNALRAARETYGADVVSLVRRFFTPENDGCGIAWLIGGGQTNITQGHEYFGYSVVSDGQDAGTDGKTYYCRDETLAHELAHNMGSAHDVVTAQGDDGVLQSDEYGRYPYSFGYRTGPGAGDFYTVMAYREQRTSAPYQTPYRVFSNPGITFCGGFACGTTGQADNTRSLLSTMPVVAAFRASVVPPVVIRPKSDFDGDGRSDIYWRHMTIGDTGLWKMAGASIAGAWGPHREPDQSWVVAGTGDFNGDSRADVLWRNIASGQVYIHFMDGPQILAISGFSATVSDTNWVIVALADFDADSKTDIYWRNVSTGLTYVWLMDGLTPSMMPVHQEPDQRWRVAGAADFNGDGNADILWRHEVIGQNYIHFMRGSTILAGSGSLPTVNESAWKVAAVGDFNGDGKSDIYWRNSSTGVTYLWILNGLSVSSMEYVHTAPIAWDVAASGDYNGDGRADIFWRNGTNGENHMHLMNGAAILSGSAAVFTVSDVNWKVVSR